MLGAAFSVAPGRLASGKTLKSISTSGRIINTLSNNLIRLQPVSFKYQKCVQALRSYHNFSSTLKTGPVSRSGLLSELNLLKAKNAQFQSTVFSKRSYATYNEIRRHIEKRTSSNNNKNGGNEAWSIIRGPLVFTVAFVVGTYFITPILFDYTPLSYFKNHKRELLFSIIGINAVIFGAWYLANNGQLPSRMQKVLYKYFLHTKNVPMRVNYPSMILSGFSHQEFFHFLFNMMCLYSFSTTVIQVLGAANFTSFYLSSIAVSSLASTIFSAVTKAGIVSSLGASGGISAIFTFFGVLLPSAPVSLFFLPIPGGASMAVAGFAAYNVAGLVLKWTTFDFAAHLGGMFVGAVYGWVIKKAVDRQRRRRVF